MSKYYKGMLKEQLDQRVKLGASWDWELTELGMGRFRATCTFRKEKNAAPIKGIGEELGKKPAEHSAAKRVLDALGINYSSPMSSPVRSSPTSSSSSSGFSSGSGSSGSVVSPLSPLVKRTEPLDEDYLLQYATSTSQNFVGMLKEFCDKTAGGITPEYTTEHWVEPDNSTRFKTKCKVEQYVCSGVARNKKDSKKIAALKCCVKIKLTSLPQKPKEPEKRRPVDTTLGHSSTPVNSTVSKPTTSIDLDRNRGSNGITGLERIAYIPPTRLFLSPENQALHSLKSLSISNTVRSPGTAPSNPSSVSSPATSETSDYTIIGKIAFDKKKVIGKGGFATVYNGYLQKPSRPMAIKESRKEDIEDPKSRELDILSEISHENLMKYYITEELNGFIYIAMDKAHSTLEEWIHEGIEVPRDLDSLVKVCRDVTTGLKMLHRNKIIHRDIKPNNVLIFLEDTSLGIKPIAKLTDFGLSRVMDKRPDGVTTSAGLKGTITYSPPELYNHTNNKYFDLQPSFDIFSLGIVLAFTMTQGKHVYGWNETSPVHILFNIMQNKVNWDLVGSPQLISLRNLLQVMLAKTPINRSEVKIILEHPFFWDSKKTFDFLLAVSNDIKNSATDNQRILDTYNNYKKSFPHLFPGEESESNWKSRLDEEIQKWISDKDRDLEESGRKGSAVQLGWRKYTGSIIQLINFIRDQNNHYKNMSSHSDLQQPHIFGKNYKYFGSYFVRKFPELPTLLYNLLQDEKIQGKHAKNFYKHNNSITFKLTWDGIIEE